jgi:copper oxidase (laccase) domain-containing protein
VGRDVYDAFVVPDPVLAAAFAPRAEGKFLADLYALARRRLALAGTVAVYGGGFCTYTDAARFYSYRRERTTGRFASLIWID